MNITVVGAGYVGLVTSAGLAQLGHNVICFDTNRAKIAQLNSGQCPIYEPQLQALIRGNQEAHRLKFTEHIHEAYQCPQMIFIAVGTPEKANGEADLFAVFQVAEQLKAHLKNDCIVIVKSTVPVGTNAKLTERLKQSSVRLTFVSNPEFLREGSAISDFFHGDRIVIGATDEYAIRKVKQLYAPLGQPIVVTTPKSAEMAKYASNAFLATKISFINEIANICEKVGADVEQVAYCMGMDGRIGSKFLKAGIGYGGSCFPKDTKALIQIAGNVAYDFELLKSVVHVNQQQIERFISKIKKYVPKLTSAKIAVLGLAFKPNTDDLREAPSIAIINALLAQGAKITAYDPVALNNAKTIFADGITYAEEINQAIFGADITIILTEWPQITKLTAAHLLTMSRPIVLDGRNCLNAQDLQENGIIYEGVGRFIPELQSIGRR